eukprot:COSAG01_NODE_7135_length_3335_cov_7.411001_5_plen_93_part_00
MGRYSEFDELRTIVKGAVGKGAGLPDMPKKNLGILKSSFDPKLVEQLRRRSRQVGALCGATTTVHPPFSRELMRVAVLCMLLRPWKSIFELS